jgi:hypothetical protein
MRRPRRRLGAAALALCIAVMLAGLSPAGADPGVDLTISNITDSPDPVKEANVVRYRVVAKNVGVGASQPITLSLFAFESGGDVSIAATDPMIESASGDGWTCFESEGWYCNDGALGPGEEANPVFVFVRAPTQETTIALNAHVFSDNSELNPFNNEATEFTDVVLSSSCEGEVSCGSGFIDFGTDSSVTTGSVPTFTHWLVGTTFFKAVEGASGGLVYNMAAVKPKFICPVNGGNLLKCTLQMNIDPIPAVFPVGHVKLTLLCHPSKCPPGQLGTATLLMFKVAEDNISRPLLRCVDGLVSPCFTAKRTSAGFLKIVVKRLAAGDPKIAGRCVLGC